MAVLFRPVVPVDYSHWSPVLREMLDPYDLCIAPEEIDPARVTYLAGWKLFPGDATMWPNLKAVLGFGAGVNQYVGHPEFPRHAALIRMIEPGLSQQMKEYVLSYVLRFHREHDRLRDLATGPWNSTIPRPARERRIGIMGLGEMGGACANALQQLGFPVLGWSRSAKNLPGIDVFSGRDGLKPFLARSDILVCLLPLTKETENILSSHTLGHLPRGACLINAARGKHLVEEDLLPLLDSGHLDQVALDVFREEPLPPAHPFWTHPRLHITPHLAAVTCPPTGGRSLKNSIDMIERGERPPGWVDLDRGY